MPDNNTIINLTTPSKQMVSEVRPSKNYSSILEKYGAKYRKVDFYWQVGDSSQVQGWILHVSVIAPQLADLLDVLLPLLLMEQVVFKIPKDRITARTILDGNLGPEQIGKIITIYPKNETDALTLAKMIMGITAPYRAPVVPTDVHLGGNVYTRYGGINPILQTSATGLRDKYIYGPDGQLTEDVYSIPFQLPAGISWPFSELANPIVPQPKKNLRDIYKPISILKPDTRGNVVKALYLKSLFQVRNCVIKQGKKDMIADDMGRDIRDRLVWQRELQQQLGGVVPLPAMLDLFEENGDTYLIMELIKGQPLNDRLVEINSGQKTWWQLSIPERTLVLDWLIKITSIIETFHKAGFVHRDIAPGNFMIDSQDQVVLIDTELAYNVRTGKNEPPFELGTPGFMSPEQEAISIPTVQEDIYGLGGLMINSFIGFSPLRFNTKDGDELLKNLAFFLRDKGVAELITSCLHQVPEQRPTVSYLKSYLQGYKRDLQTVDTKSKRSNPDQAINPVAVRQVIQDALAGLSERPMPVSEGLWMSKTSKKNYEVVTGQKDFSAYVGLHTGMSGVLYILAKTEKMGFPIEPNRKNFEESWKYVTSKYVKDAANITLGLYAGSAGMAMALKEGIDANLLLNKESIRQQLLDYLDRPSEKLTLAEGVAGQGIAILQSRSYLPPEKARELLDRCIEKLLGSQQKDGSWKIRPDDSQKEYVMPVGLAHGMSGILWFLLECLSIHTDSRVQNGVFKALGHLLKRTNQLKGLFEQNNYQKIKGPFEETGDERTGVILCMIKAYEVLKDNKYRDLSEAALYNYPDFVINNNISQDGGIATLGELYLEAGRIFQQPEWQWRAERIASVYLHTAYREPGKSCYWLMDETNKPVADLMIGNAGIIHFLLRCLQPTRPGYILLA